MGEGEVLMAAIWKRLQVAIRWVYDWITVIVGLFVGVPSVLLDLLNAFAGVDISGTKWELDYSANRKAYGDAAEAEKGGDAGSVQKLLATDGGKAPEIFKPFLESLEKNVGAGKTK